MRIRAGGDQQWSSLPRPHSPRNSADCTSGAPLRGDARRGVRSDHVRTLTRTCSPVADSHNLRVRLRRRRHFGRQPYWKDPLSRHSVFMVSVRRWESEAGRAVEGLVSRLMPTGGTTCSFATTLLQTVMPATWVQVAGTQNRKCYNLRTMVR